MDFLRIRGARTHNLKNINVEFARNQLVVITGLSGSGKSSLAFDTIFAEGQRRYMESLSSYARQFLQMMEKPDVDVIEGLSPAIAIEQKATSHNPRSTVGTVTEIHDYLRLLYARVGDPYCPNHPDQKLEAMTVSQMVDSVLALPPETKLMILAPVFSNRKGEHLDIVEKMRGLGFVRMRVDGKVYEIDDVPKLAKNTKHSLEVVVDRVKIRAEFKQRLAESFETALEHGNSRAIAVDMDTGAERLFSAKFACPICDYALAELEPRMFSFNNPVGACPACDGLGEINYFDPSRIVSFPELSLAGGAIKGWDRRNPFYFRLLQSLAKFAKFDLETPFEKLPKKIRDLVLFGSGKQDIAFYYTDGYGRTQAREHPFEGVVHTFERRFRETDSFAVRDWLSRYISQKPCPTCHGSRLRPEALNVKVGGRRINEVSSDSLKDALAFFKNVTFSGSRAAIAEKIIKEIATRLSFLNNVGLEYLSLDRSAETLSGGEAQRIRLASQIGSGLTGVMYVLDEPSIGLHQRDNDKLLDTLKELRDIGNTVIVVEHDEDAIRAADHVIDIGPGPGSHGGEVVAEGTPEEICKNKNSLTGKYLSGELKIEIPKRHPPKKNQWLTLSGARGNNLKNVTLKLPVGLFVCVTGVSGSGKSTLVNDTLYKAVAQHLYDSSAEPMPYDSLDGLDFFDKVISVDQAPIGRTPRSNPATYTGLFTPIRELFSQLPESRERGYGSGRFSFNVKGGRCEACQGDGLVKVEMHFLPDIYVPCDICHGARYNRETLEVRYKGKNIAEVLAMTVEEAHEFFNAVPNLERRLKTLLDVGLGYCTLGQSATTLSGGEAQRVKLALELSKRDTGRTLYILDEPTTGLHFHDIKQLLDVLNRLRDSGNTIVVIEHNLDVVKNADWIIDLGQEGGEGGGKIIAQGTPEKVMENAKSYTGIYLKKHLEAEKKKRPRKAKAKKAD
jgi:excinuclease ABC subunit A